MVRKQASENRTTQNMIDFTKPTMTSYQKLKNELFNYKSLAKNYRTQNYNLLEIIINIEIKNSELSENYLNSRMLFPNRQDYDISKVFNGVILSFWLKTNQCEEKELSEKQKYYAGIKDILPEAKEQE